ncbi:MAG: hypothetical protein IPI32_04005 [Austwickia sp.]|nr:hypothetical protein [Austwickia sp.]MBK9100422.1 hypothetical protein [Austwickia sp.]
MELVPRPRPPTPREPRTLFIRKAIEHRKHLGLFGLIRILAQHCAR